MPQQLDGRYEILKPLGTGGFGKTYLARDLRIPGTPYCVVKQLHCASQKPEDKQLAKELFQREAESLAKLGHHDQIPRLLAYFTENDEFYLVEDFVEGRSLEDEIKTGQPWPEADVIRLLQSLLDVLAFVHRQGVIHRDIKPGNLIRRQSDGKVVLIDFGAIKEISQAQVSTAHRTGTQIGTVGYMPPEQAQGKPRPNSDVYGVGIVGISALTGHPAMGLPDDPQTGEVVWQHLASVTPGFAQILSRMVRYYFQHRYQTVEEVQQALHGLSPSSTTIQSPSPVAEASQVTSPDPVLNAPLSPIQSAHNPSARRSRKAPWLLGIGLAVVIPVFGGVASLLFNARPNFTNAIDSAEAEADKPCTAVVVGNIRSERTAYRGTGNILQTGQGKAFDIGTQETRGGWIQIKLPSNQIAWTHLDVVANETALKDCLSQKNIALELIADIPPPPRPQPRPVVPTPSPPNTPSPAVDPPAADNSPVPDARDLDLSPSPDSTSESQSPEAETSDTPVNIEESQPLEETAPPPSSSPDPDSASGNRSSDTPSDPGEDANETSES